ncbi:MAG: serine hydrolase domain-containing protein [Candidatus Neomarinimicrobiota bacterium]
MKPALKWLAILPVLFALLLLNPSCGREKALADFFDQEFDAYIKRVLYDWNAPGVVISVVKDGQHIFAKGYGSRQAGEDLPVDEHTLCTIASNTKAMTATALAMLVDEGKLKWDDPVKRYIPELKCPDDYVTENMTIRDLLAHRAGLPFRLGEWNDPDYTMERLLGDLPLREPATGFRERHAYSNVGYALAGEVVARLSGMSWEEFVTSRIFEPLGMSSTYASPTRLEEALGEPAQIENLFLPAYEREGEVVATDWRGFGYVYAPAAGVITTAEDIAKWMIFQLNEGVIEGQRLVSEVSVQEMLTPQISVDRVWWEHHSVLANFLVYDLGWVSYDHRGRRVNEHPGGGMWAVVALVPEEDLGVAIFTNLWWTDFKSVRMVNAIKLRIIDAFLGAPEHDWCADYLQRHKQWLARRAGS